MITLVLLAALSLDAPLLSTIAGTGSPGQSGDGGSATKATINQPFDLAFAPSGDLIFSDTGNHKIRRIDARTQVISTLAGTGVKGFSGDGGPANEARLDEPYGLAIDAEGSIYFADRLNRRVRRVKEGIIATIAGDGSKAFSGDGGPAVLAGLVEPNGVALDGKGHLLIADVADHRVRSVDLKSGIITTFAGDGQGRHAGGGGPAKKASIHGARAVKVGPDGTVWILERGGNRLRSVDPRTGIIVTRAGTGQAGYSGDGGLGIRATFNGPKELGIDGDGQVYIVDTENHAIRLFEPKTGKISDDRGGWPERHGRVEPARPTSRRRDRSEWDDRNWRHEQPCHSIGHSPVTPAGLRCLIR